MKNNAVHQDRHRLYQQCVHPYEEDEPEGYVAWHIWAEKHGRTHEHRPCPDCGLYVICRRKSAES